MKTKAFNGFEFQIDPEDLWVLTLTRWRACRVGKIRRIVGSFRGKAVYLPRVLLGAQGRWSLVDHINHDPLDNRKANLRLCGPAENCRNRSMRFVSAKYGLRGVDRENSRYRASIDVSGKTIRSSWFKSIFEAAYAYDKLASFHHGDFAQFNFPCAYARRKDP